LPRLSDIQLIKKLLLRRGEVVGHVGHGTKRQRRRGGGSCSTHGFTVCFRRNTVLSLTVNRPNDVRTLTSQLLWGLVRLGKVAMASSKKSVLDLVVDS
jgi:hypothetical protein